MKIFRIILLAALAIGVASCGSSRKIPTAEKQTLAELQKKLKSEPDQALRRLLAEAYSWEGTPYKWGGETKQGVDCSGLTMKVFQNSLGIKLPRNSAKQQQACDRISRSKLLPGDLVFFNSKGGGGVSHVGLYVGDNMMIHASSHGVMFSGLSEPYYQNHFHSCGRVPEFDKMRRSKKVEAPAVAVSEAGAASTDDNTSGIETALREMMARYPQAQLKDIYKSFFQDCFGPGHILADETQARSYLDWELAQPAAYTSGPLYEPTGAEGNYYRVDLRAVSDGLVPYEVFFRAFADGARTEPEASVPDFAARWEQVVAAARRLGLDSLPNFEADARRIDEALAAGRYVGHHSDAFQQAYDPHYRIISREIFMERIMPYLK